MTRAILLFVSQAGDYHRSVATSFYRLLRQQADKGVTPFRFHDLRHAFAVDYLKAGGSIYDLQQHLGHTSVATTEIYLQFLSGSQKHAAKSGYGLGTKLGTVA
jgi:integrase/recombinase XerD